MKLSDYVMSFLYSKGIDTVFTVSGGGCIHLIDSLGKSKLDYVCTHHEQAAAMAAEGYARLGEREGAVLVTTGPGGTNALTGCLGSWLDSIPVFFISGQVNMDQTRLYTGCRQVGDQEYNIVDSVRPMTKYAQMVTKPEQIRFIMEMAWYEMTHGRPGPVWVDIPLDIQAADIDPDKLTSFTPYPCPKPSYQIGLIEQAISESKKPLFVVGNGVRLSKSYDKFNKVLEKTGIPVLSTVHSGIDCINNEYEYYAGRIGILGNITSNRIVQESDLLIILGSRLTVKGTGYNTKEFAPHARKIYVDIDRQEIRKHKFPIDHEVVDDIGNFLDNVNIEPGDIADWQNYVKEERSTQKQYLQKHKDLKGVTSAYYFMSELNKNNKGLPIITSDGSAHVVTLQTLLLKDRQRMFTNVGCASMGYGLPAAIGAAFLSPVICLEGDGSLQMNVQELQTVRHYDLPIKLIVINNDGYLSIKMTQDSFFGKRYACDKKTGVSFPELSKIAKAYGIPYKAIHNNDECEFVLKEIMNYHQVILEVFCDPEEKHEPKVCHKGFDENGKIIPGTLTDMK